MPVSLPEGEVGVSVSFRTISLPFEVIRAEYLSRTQWLRKGGHLVHFAPGINWPRGLKRTIYIIGASLSEPHTDKFRFCRVYIYIYMRRTYGLP